MSTLIGLRVSAIDRDDPNRGRKAFRIFLEAILVAELGEQLVNEPRFQQLVDQVQGAIDADPQTQAMSQEAITQLLQQSSSTRANQDK